MALLSLADLEKRVYNRLDQNTQLYTKAEVDSVINEAYRLTNLALGYQQGAVAVPGWSQVNRHYYDVPQGIVIPLRVQWENSYLQPTSLVALGKAHPNWTLETTANTGLPVSSWFRLGLRKFGIWPATSQDGQQILVTGILEVTLLVNATDTVNWSQDVLAAFDLYCSHVLQLKESSRTFAQSSGDYKQYLAILRHQTYLAGWKQPQLSQQMRQTGKS